MNHQDFLVQLSEMEKKLDHLESTTPAQQASNDPFNDLVDCPDIDAFLQEMSKVESQH